MAEATNITRGLFGQRLSKKLPWMVDWFDPVLLGLVGIRTLISTTIGQYADQRPVQAAMDREDDRTALALRHDFSGARAKELVLDKDGALWVDFIADLGDGYEATYAMAYLMASSTLAVRGADTPDGKLDGGEILIFGGDLAYPNATVKEYQDRCLDPYDAAFPGEGQREKKLFFIAGNHDWYDGLAAFTSVFCAARSYAARGLKIGGWRCEQRRSYFALKLPHDWWIWGFDSGLSDSIDEAQSVYFAAVAKETKPNEKIIVVTHTPAWVDRHDEGLAEIVELVRETAKEKPGLEICAVIAGDLHHYSRYVSQAKDRPPVHLITSGGGGAFLHPTHQLKNTVDISFTGGDAGADEDQRRQRRRGKAKRGQRFRATAFYPSKWRSRMLTFKNLFLPFRNKRFAVLLGVIYFLYAWFYAVSVAQNQMPERLPAVSSEEAAAARGSAIAAASQARPALDRFLDLAGRQDAVPQLKTAAAAARDAADKTKNAVEAARAEVDKAAEAEAALKRAWAAKEDAEKQNDAASAAVKAPGRTAPSADVTAAAEAAKKKLEDAQAELDRAGKEAQAAPGKVDEARAKAYKEADNAIELAYAAFAELDAASSRVQGQPGADDLANAAAQARVVMDQARSAVQHAEKIEARATMLKDHAKKFERKWDTSGTKLWSELLKAALNNPGFLFMLVALWFGLVYYVDAALTSAWLSWLNWPIKLWFGSLHFAYHISALVFVDWVAQGVNNVFKVITGTLLVAGSVIWAGFKAAWKYGSETGPDAQQKMAMQFQEDLAWFGKCWEKLQVAGHQDWTGFGHCVAGNYDLGLQISTILAHATTSIVLGGILGAFIFGFYWVTTTAMFGMHMDAFSALGLRDYKNFLRMRFEQDKATIYAIGLDQVPGRYGWRRPKNGEVLPDNKPQIQPKRPLRPHVIEKFVISRTRKPETQGIV